MGALHKGAFRIVTDALLATQRAAFCLKPLERIAGTPKLYTMR
jgi:hypothetical protein